MSAVPAPPTAANRWNWADLAVAVGIFMAVSLLLFPAIEKSRFRAQLAACQDNLRRFGMALAQYSHRHEDQFPQVSQRNRFVTVGLGGPAIGDDGYLLDSRRLVCPASPLAADPRFRTLAAADLLLPESLQEPASLPAAMVGGYGYALGHVQRRLNQDARNLREPFVAVVADASGDYPDRRAINHGGLGWNVLFGDGRAVFYALPRASGEADVYFVNGVASMATSTQGREGDMGSGRAVPVLFLGRPER